MDERQSGFGDDDDFGLPEARLRPRNTGKNAEEKTPVTAPPDHSSTPVVEVAQATGSAPPKSGVSQISGSGGENPGISRLLLILIPILTVLLALKGYFYFHIAPDIAVEQTEQVIQPENKPVVSAVKPQEPEKVIAEPVNPAIARTEILSTPTGRFHVVIKSAVDKESIMNEANQLNTRGIGCLIIPMDSNSPSNRLVLFSTETAQQAKAKADSLRPTFGAGIWILKY